MALIFSYFFNYLFWEIFYKFRSLHVKHSFLFRRFRINQSTNQTRGHWDMLCSSTYATSLKHQNCSRCSIVHGKMDTRDIWIARGFLLLMGKIPPRLQSLDMTKYFQGWSYFQTKTAEDILSVKEEQGSAVNVLEEKAMRKCQKKLSPN